ncbi:MAG: methyltransferase domain-containing protein [Rhodospirillales bacterium]|nr:methyltransferase domain-containing protein [Rhodospirillales bacterium]
MRPQIVNLILSATAYRLSMDRFLESFPAPAGDCWSNWINHGRDGGNAAVRAHVTAQTAAFAEKILNSVQAPPATMLDIGSGDGLMAWAALSRWPCVKMTMTDISPALLLQAQIEAIRRGADHQCFFMLANAETLENVADRSQDLVTSRSALAYVVDKPAAFRAAFRVLKPGGMISIAEPLFREQALSLGALQMAPSDTVNLLLELLCRWKAAQFVDPIGGAPPNQLTSYTERDLLSFAGHAGFQDLHLELHIDERQAPPRDWEAFCAMSPHPLAPSSAEILTARFSPAEQKILEAALRPSVEKGGFSITTRMIYLCGRKAG